MSGSRPPRRRRRRSSGVVPTVPGNELFTRVREELELYLSPRRAGEVLEQALRAVGSSPRQVELGHMVRIVDVHLLRALETACTPDEADELHRRVCQVLDELAGRFFHPSG
ncbi:MAG TPA: hypothetical protein VKN99_08975 [Polyangia bacterium]|nr:hypothetical protein [Polyangia bacterium]